VFLVSVCTCSVTTLLRDFVMTKKDEESGESEEKGELPCFVRHFTLITRVCAVLVIIGTL